MMKNMKNMLKKCCQLTQVGMPASATACAGST